MKYCKQCILFFITLIYFIPFAKAQINWAPDGKSYYDIEDNEIFEYSLPDNTKQLLVGSDMLTIPGGESLDVRAFYWSLDGSKVLIYTNSKKVWRLRTQGDYWVLNMKTKSLKQIGTKCTPSSLRFAKFSPDGKNVAYVSEYNVYVENLETNQVNQLTKDGSRKLINGTFDWAYEEEFACRDGFQWSPDSQRIAFWQIDARNIADYNMFNLTDSVYSKVIPVEYPTAGQDPSAAKIGVIHLANNQTTWLNISGDPKQHYLPRMEWNSASELFVQQLNRKQNESKIFNCNVLTNDVQLVFKDKDKAWIDVLSVWDNVYTLHFRHEFKWLNNKKEFLWFSEQDGWRHLYRIDKKGKIVLITKGDFDVMNVMAINEKENLVYFTASPDNATQKYLYKTKLDGSGNAERLSPSDLEGTHSYDVSPNGIFASHGFQNTFTRPLKEMISLPKHEALFPKKSIQNNLASNQVDKKVEFFKVKIKDGTEMDGWMVKPKDFDPNKKYPIVFLVYTEPWGANVKDRFNVGANRLYKGNMADDGYIYMTVDNRGTPAPKGREWRKSIYRKIGKINISDQAMAAKEIIKWDFVDKDRIAVWGWSGGGTATLNLLFQFPKIYHTGIAIAAVANQLTYDNIYQERFMGLPQENLSDFVDNSPLAHAKNLKGNLLYIHGTGDDNVHYNNAEMLVNELVKHNKQFQFMAYPNRAHGLREGEGTYEHSSTLYTNFLKQNCPPGGR